MDARSLTRRRLLQGAGTLGVMALTEQFAPAWAGADMRRAALQPDTPHAAHLAGERGDRVLDLVIEELRFSVNGRTGTAIAMNGTVPGPLIRLREGTEAELRVTNRLNEISSIHWHGLLVPPDMDGVPGVSFAGIRPGETFTYRFPVRQNGTYWAHSHSGGQELLGLYMPIIIDPKDPDPVQYDRDYVVMLSDWSFMSPETLIGKLKKQAGYFNRQRRTTGELISDFGKHGFGAVLKERGMWAKMRMDPTDFADVTGVALHYLLNGRSPEANWTGLFTPGEKVRLRFINAAASTIFDVRLPGLKLRVVQADGQNVQPIEVDEFRIGPAETYDVIVEPEDRAYTLFAESIGRSGYTRGTLAPRPGMSAPVPKMRPRPIRTMADMGMEMSAMGGGKGPHAGHSLGGMGTEKREKPSGQAGMEMSGMPGPSTASGRMAVPGVRLLAPDGSYLSLPSMGLPGMKKPGKPMPAMPGMDHGGATKPGRGAPESKPMPAMPGMDHGGAAKPGRRPPETKPMPADHGDAAKPGVEQKGTGQEHSGHAMGAMPDSAPEAPGYMHGGGAHGVGNSTAPMSVRSRMGEPGIGLEDTGSRVLVYTDLKSLTEREDQRPPSREIELHITGNMERFVWGFNGKKYSQSGPVRFNYGERVRLILVNDTMMEHPIHLHGMWMEAENGAGRFLPRKHTVTVKPAERFPVLITADAPGHWAMHCHLLLHMEMGMFRVVEVIEGGDPEVINGDPGPRPTPVRENIAMNRRLSARPPYGEGTASHE